MAYFRLGASFTASTSPRPEAMMATSREKPHQDAISLEFEF
jgi:hypothetical protein